MVESLRNRFPMVSLEFFIDIILPAALWHRGRLRNEYQQYFLVGKGDRYIGLRLSPSYADCLEILEPQTPGTLPGLPRPVMRLLFYLMSLLLNLHVAT